jgi:hypothetical protein
MRHGHQGRANVPVYNGTHELFKKIATDSDLYQIELMDMIMCHIYLSSSGYMDVIKSKVQGMAAEYKANKKEYTLYLQSEGYE